MHLCQATVSLLSGRCHTKEGFLCSVGAMRSVKDVLGLYAYPLGFELTDEKWHAANEFFRLSSVRKGQLVYCFYLLHLADEESKLKK
jgi:hypothetical protein